MSVKDNPLLDSHESSNGSDQNIINQLKYPRTLNYKIWESYLGRKLEYAERHLIEDCKAEKQLNYMLHDLHNNCHSKNYYVPLLTDSTGDCLFESLVYHNIGGSIEELRLMLSMVFYIFQNYKNFLPGVEETLLELFGFSNEIEYVSTKDEPTHEKQFYKYSYSIMCQDLGNLYCWSRLPTQLLLLVASYLYKTQIIIVHSINGHETIIDAYESNNLKASGDNRIYLGLLGESHYVPINIINSSGEGEEDRKILYYTEFNKKLTQFGEFMEKINIEAYIHRQKQEKQIEETENTIFSELNDNSFDDMEVNFT
jgi:hypothetical protein